MYTENQIIQALKHVKYPGHPLDIVEDGIVQDLQVQGNQVSYKLVLQKARDPFAASLQKGAVAAIHAYVSKELIVKDEVVFQAPQPKPQDLPLPGVKNIIAVASGKGGVGKSTVAVNLAVSLALKGFSVGLIDADVYGPSIPKMFNVEGVVPEMTEQEGKEWIVPVEKYGVKLLSVGFFVKPGDALMWRGPMATSALKQLINQGAWGELDFLLLDLPPGTGDVHLTMVQEIPVTGAVVVSTPQEVALVDVLKAINMFQNDKINIPILGLVENMAWFTPAELPENKYFIFGKGGCLKLSEERNLPLLGQIPIVQSICEDGDRGVPTVSAQHSIVGKAFLDLTENLLVELEKRNASQAPTKIVEITQS